MHPARAASLERPVAVAAVAGDFDAAIFVIKS